MDSHDVQVGQVWVCKHKHTYGYTHLRILAITPSGKVIGSLWSYSHNGRWEMEISIADLLKYYRLSEPDEVAETMF